MYAAISADIISSTSLSVQETIKLKKRIYRLFDLLEKTFFGFRGRQIKGDYIECLIPNASQALRIALIIKSSLKFFSVERDKEKDKFLKYGLRMAISIGDMSHIDDVNDIWDGEAIYKSGRTLEKMNSLKKGTLNIVTNQEALSPALHTVGILIDSIMNDITRRQSEVLYYKLLGYKEEGIAKKLRIKQSSVNEHSTSGKWNFIKEALNYFENINFSK